MSNLSRCPAGPYARSSFRPSSDRAPIGPWITGIDGVKRRKALLEQPRVPVPWSREGHAGFPKPRREQAVALVRAGAVLCLATSNPGAFRNAWNEFMRETFLPAEIPPLSRVV